MEGTPKPRPSFEKVGENSAGYPVYERVPRDVQQEMVDIAHEWPAPEYEALEKPQQRGRLRMALAVVGALGAGVTTKAMYDYNSERMSPERDYVSASYEPEASIGEMPKESMVNDRSVDDVIESTSTPAPESSLRPQAREIAGVAEAEMVESVATSVESAPKQESVMDTDLAAVASEQTASPEMIIDLEGTEYGKRIEGYIARLQLRKDEVLFLDEYGAPVGAPIKMEAVDGPLPPGKTVKEGQAPIYKYSPGEMEDVGFPVAGVVPEWLDHMQELQQAKFPDHTITDRTHVVTDFQAIFKDSDLTDLQEKVRSGEVETYEDILEYFIEQPFVGSEGLNKIEYLRKHVQFRSEDEEVKISDTESVTFRAVPPEVQERLLFYIPGILAQESKFNDNIENQDTGAAGCAQFIQDTWQRYTGEDTVSKECARQIAVIGPALSDMYDRVLDKLTPEAEHILPSQFSTELEYQLELICRMTVAGFNNGPDRTAEAASRYTESVQVDDMSADADLFMNITEYGKLAEGGRLSGYKTDSAEYMERVEAQAIFLAEKYPPKDQELIVSYGDGEQYAMNN